MSKNKIFELNMLEISEASIFIIFYFTFLCTNLW